MVYDVQLIVAGKHHQFQFGIDEHVFAALSVYMDIINLLIRLIHIFGDRR